MTVKFNVHYRKGSPQNWEPVATSFDNLEAAVRLYYHLGRSGIKAKVVQVTEMILADSTSDAPPVWDTADWHNQP